jgi:hypothetical protein
MSQTTTKNGEAISVKRGQMPYAPGDFAVINKLLWISLLMMDSPDAA